MTPDWEQIMSTFLKEYMDSLARCAEVDQMVATETARLHRDWMRTSQEYRDQFGPDLGREFAHAAHWTRTLASLAKRNPAVFGTIELCLIPITDLDPEDRDPDDLRTMVPVVALVVAESGTMPDEVN